MSQIKRMKLARLAMLMQEQSQNVFLITPKLIDCFASIISEEEADFLLAAGTETHAEVGLRALSGKTEEEFRPFFNEILRKGLMLMREHEDGARSYDLDAIVVGWVEFVLADGRDAPEKTEFIKNFDEYFRSFAFLGQTGLASALNFFTSKKAKPTMRVSGMELGERPASPRTVRLDAKVAAMAQHIHPADKILGYLDKAAAREQIALLHCFCRRWREILGRQCQFGQATESCLTIGYFSKQLVEHGIGRFITKDQAVAVIEETRQRGSIHVIFHERDELDLPEVVICNCCWDCCGFLGSYNRGLTSYNCRSHYLTARVRPQDCILCNRCVRYCPAGAIRLGDDGQIQVQTQLCIGCGQCAFQCPRQVYDLTRSDRDVFLPILKPSDIRIS